MGRAPCCDKANVKKGPWSPEEDLKLKEYIEKHGNGGNWIALPQKAGLKRCGKSCRLRWLNYLRPNIKHGEFSEEEDRVICSLFATIGSRWSIIAAQLPGRTDNDIKNYWNTKLKKKLLAMAPQSQKKATVPPFTSSNYTPLIPTSSYNCYYPSNLESLVPIMSSDLLDHNGGSVSFATNSSMFQVNDQFFNTAATTTSPFQFYQYPSKETNLWRFGSTEGSCSSNSDGSFKDIKQEEHMGLQGYINESNDNHKFVISYGNNETNLGEIGGQLIDYDQNVNQMINSSNNNVSSSSLLLIDENKRQDKNMYKYNYNYY